MRQSGTTARERLPRRGLAGTLGHVNSFGSILFSMLSGLVKAALFCIVLLQVWSADGARAETEDTGGEELTETLPGSTADAEPGADDAPPMNRPVIPITRLPRSHRRAAVMSDEAHRMNALAAELGTGADEAVWLGGDQQRFFSLFRPESTGYPQGGIILIHENGGHVAQPGVIEGIRTSLPNFGWSTLAISVPDLKQVGLPPRTRSGFVRRNQPHEAPVTDPSIEQKDEESDHPGSEAEPTPGGPTADADRPVKETTHVLNAGRQKDDNQPVDLSEAPADPLDGLFDDLVGRINASIQYMQASKGQYNLVFLGVGSGAHLLARYAQSQAAAGKATAIQGMVLVNANQSLQPGGAVRDASTPNTANPSAVSLPDLLANLYMPILDLYHDNSAGNIANAKIRLDQASRYHLTSYTQVRIPPVSRQSYSRNNRVIRRVRGWLAKYAEGMEIEKANR